MSNFKNKPNNQTGYRSKIGIGDYGTRLSVLLQKSIHGDEYMKNLENDLKELKHSIEELNTKIHYHQKRIQDMLLVKKEETDQHAKLHDHMGMENTEQYYSIRISKEEKTIKELEKEAEKLEKIQKKINKKLSLI